MTAVQGSIRLLREGRADGLSAALQKAWPAPPAGGRVALLCPLVDSQGEVGSGAVDDAIVLAAVKQLSSRGATVTVVDRPMAMDRVDLWQAKVDALRGLGIAVADGQSSAPDMEDAWLAGIGLLDAVAQADHIAVVAPVSPHRAAQVSGVGWALWGALAPEGRTRAMAAALGAEQGEAALNSLVGRLAPQWNLALLPEAELWIAGESIPAIRALTLDILGLSPPEAYPRLKIEGLDPALVRRVKNEEWATPPTHFPGVDARLCTACGSCPSLCPTGAIDLPEGASVIRFDLSHCVRCGICAAGCPDFAIQDSVQSKGVRMLTATPSASLTIDPDAVPLASALALGPNAIDPKPRRPAWLESYRPAPEVDAPMNAGGQLAWSPRWNEPNPDRLATILLPPPFDPATQATSRWAAAWAGAWPDASIVDLGAWLWARDPGLVQGLRAALTGGDGIVGSGAPGLAAACAGDGSNSEEIQRPSDALMARQIRELATRSVARWAQGTQTIIILTDATFIVGVAMLAAALDSGCSVSATGPKSVIERGRVLLQDAGSQVEWRDAPPAAASWRDQRIPTPWLRLAVTLAPRDWTKPAAHERLWAELNSLPPRTCIEVDAPHDSENARALANALAEWEGPVRWRVDSAALDPEVLHAALAAGAESLSLAQVRAGLADETRDRLLQRAAARGLGIHWELISDIQALEDGSPEEGPRARHRVAANLSRAPGFSVAIVPPRGRAPSPTASASAADMAWTAFGARRGRKIPILNEELPFCNDNCLHCGVADIMKTANVVGFADIANELRRLVVPSQGRVMFAVSELTIRPDFIKIVRAARAVGMRTIALVTNGRMFAYPEFTKRTVAAGITHALVSVYGPTPRIHQAITRTPRSFEQTIDGLKALLARPEVTVMTNSVITKKNARYLPQLVELLAGLGVRNINLSFVQIVGAAEHYARSLIPQISEVLPFLREAVDLGLARGLNMGIGGLPYCVMKGYERCFGVDDLTYIENGMQQDDSITSRSPYTRAKVCEGCAMSAVCLGMQDTYLERYGEGALKPYLGPRVVARPPSSIAGAMFPELKRTASGAHSSLFGAPSPSPRSAGA